uniref:AIG1-type G domain-containing protein n=1 Tax=Astyanax mexicanus TaxID=7994 RepID=A0A8B9I100_ASTMX
MQGGEELRIVLLGKTGVGKSAVGNTILGEKVFKTECSQKSATKICQRAEIVIDGRRIVVIDTPGFFDTEMSEKDLKQEIISCLVQCAPGPHVFILVLKVERYTKENQQTVEKLLELLSGDVVHHMVLLFTYGDELDDNMTIQDFINKSDNEGSNSGKQSLKGLAERCGNRVHVIDNKHWKENSRETQANPPPWFGVLLNDADSAEVEYHNTSEQEQCRECQSNPLQLTLLMKSIKMILSKNNGQAYSNETLKAIGEVINKAVNRTSAEGNTDRTQLAEIMRRVTNMLMEILSGVTGGVLLRVLLGGTGSLAAAAAIPYLIRKLISMKTQQHPQAGGPPVQTEDVGAGAAAGVDVVAGISMKIKTSALAAARTEEETAVLGAEATASIEADIVKASPGH